MAAIKLITTEETKERANTFIFWLLIKFFLFFVIALFFRMCLRTSSILSPPVTEPFSMKRPNNSSKRAVRLLVEFTTKSDQAK